LNHCLELCIVGAAAMALISGCSSPERSTPQALASQTQALVPTNIALIPATLSAAGTPMSTHTAGVMPVSTPSAAGNAQSAQIALGGPSEIAKLRGIALGVSSGAGVSSPKTMHVVAASERQAAQTILSGAIIHDHAPVYVIKMTGGPFTAKQHPPGIPAPQGEFLTLTVDAATHHVTDVGYVDVEPDLSKIGSLAVDLLAP
jgi:hypothetical protein